jgi:hypothetical protein
MKRIQVLALVAFLLIVLGGCEKATVTNQASVDVFLKIKKNSQGTTLYAVVHSVVSYNLMSEVKVTAPNGSSTLLTNFENGGNSFFNDPADEDFSETAPPVGTYSYLVTFKNGEQITYTNSLLAGTILPAAITGLNKNATGDSIYFTWNAIANTQAYQLKVTNGTKQIYYQAPFADISSPLKATLRIVFPLSAIFTNGSGIYTFELDGMLFESTSATDFLQAISVSSKDISL